MGAFYLRGIIHSKLLESEVCEQAARSNAMENATDNANELLNDLKTSKENDRNRHEFYT